MLQELYLESVQLVSEREETKYILNQKRTCYNTMYPFNLFPNIFENENDCRIEFSPITILYGGNGTGKTTLLNIIAEGLDIRRHSSFNSSAFFKEYVSMCEFEGSEVPSGSQILTSDDVSDFLLNMRDLNKGIEARKIELMDEYLEGKYSSNRFTSLDDYDSWKQRYDAKRKSQSAYVKERLVRNVDMFSNGETAMRYYVERINENALYLIDEPENSLSPKLQLELADYIFKSARFFGCQFVISTHSPFFLSLEEAEIYDLETFPVSKKKWSELTNVKIYYDFFKRHGNQFEHN